MPICPDFGSGLQLAQLVAVAWLPADGGRRNVDGIQPQDAALIVTAGWVDDRGSLEDSCDDDRDRYPNR